MSVLSLTRFKRCSKCGCYKPVTRDFFHRRKSSADGFRIECKPCHIADVRRYTKANKAKRRVYLKAYYVANCQALKASANAYREANKEEVARRKKTHYLAHRKEILAKVKKWQKDNPLKELARRQRHYEQNKEMYSEYSARRRARKAAASGTHTQNDVWRIYDEQSGCCAYCDHPLFGTFHVDHVTPLCRGGSDSAENIAVACPTCNLKKGKRTGEEFRAILEA